MEKMVDALENGKIVKVSEAYAKREGLLILRNDSVFHQEEEKALKRKKEDEEYIRVGFEELRKPLSWKKKQVVSELVDNFHWVITNERKTRNMTRRQVAKDLGISENDLKMVENGVLPNEDFVLINKIQKYYNVNLRKDGADFTKSARSLLKEDKIPAKTEGKESRESKETKDRGSGASEGKDLKSTAIGDEIEIFDD